MDLSPPGSSSAAESDGPLPKLTFLEKTTLGVGGLLIVGANVVQNMAIAVYQMMMHVDPALLGVALAIPRIWDALIDPKMGNISDNFRSRWGRRRPFIVVGALAMGISYALIWMVSPEWSQTGKLVYLVVTSILFYTCYAIFSIPYQCLTYEASPDYNERTVVMAHYCAWYRVGDLTYAWLFPIAQKIFAVGLVATPMMGVHAVNWIFGICIFCGIGVIPGIFGKERYYKRAVAQAKMNFWAAFRDAMRNKALLFIIALAMLKILPYMLASAMDQYILVYYMFHGDLEQGLRWKAILTSGYGVMGLIAIPLVGALANRFSKRVAMMIVYALVIVAGFGKWFLFVPGNHYLILLDAICSAPIWVGLSMLLPSMLADACDEEELERGQRAEGIFGAVYNWIIKAGMSLGFLGTGLLLNFIGFDTHLGGSQSPHTFFWMRFSLAGITTFSAIIGVIVAYFYPISKQRALETRRLLEERRGAV